VHSEPVRGFRPPAIPLINLSPNVAAWLRADNLTDQTPSFWYERWNSTLAGYLRVDGAAYRFLGLDAIAQPFSSTFKGHSGVRPGKDLPDSPVRLGTATDCALRCDTTTGCKAWTWYPSCGGSSASLCYLKAEVQAVVADSCAVSDLQAVYLPDSSIEGEANHDGGGREITSLYILGGQSRDCAMQCFQTVGCDEWIFSQEGWLMAAGATISPYPNDCRTTGPGPYRLGWIPPSEPATSPLLQTELVVTPTRTTAVLVGAGVELQLTFLQPSLPHDIATSAREHTYIAASVRASDGQSHSVQLYLDAATDIVVNAFVSGRALPPTDSRQPRASNDDMTVSAFTFDLGAVGQRAVELQLVFLVDEQWPIYYFRQLLTPTCSM
jgi:hypothetical protein